MNNSKEHTVKQVTYKTIDLTSDQRITYNCAIDIIHEMLDNMNVQNFIEDDNGSSELYVPKSFIFSLINKIFNYDDHTGNN